MVRWSNLLRTVSVTKLNVVNYLPTILLFAIYSLRVFHVFFSFRLSGMSPFMGDNDAETFTNITKAEFDFDDEAFDAISQDSKDFISALLIKRKEYSTFSIKNLKCCCLNF